MWFPASQLARFELRRFRGTMPRVALVFVLLVPLLYGAIYLSANWDPYGKLDRLPVAVVNHDQPATAEGRTVTAGADLVANLHASNAFAWHDTDDAAAADGLAHGDYYLVLTIPSHFSADLVSGAGDHPQRAEIDLRRNDANGFVVGSITNSAQNTITRAVDASAQESYFNAVFANLATIRTGFDQAADGAGELSDGLDQARTGAVKLDDGAADAETGAGQLSTGATRLATGLDSAKTGADQLSSGLGTLDTKLGQLATGARQVADGTQRLDDQVVPPLRRLQRSLPGIQDDAQTAAGRIDGVSQTLAGRSGSVASDLDQADRDLAQLERDHPELAQDPAFDRLTDRVGSAADRADRAATDVQSAAGTVHTITTAVRNADDLSQDVRRLTDNLVALNRGAQSVADGASALHAGIGTAASGADNLAAGISTADTGANDLAAGAADLRTGLDTLHDGTTSLRSAFGPLAEGAPKLHTSPVDGAARIPAVTAEQQADAVQVLSAPANVQQMIDNPATFYGRGLAPLFLAIALWVFGISVFLVVRPITGRSLAGRASPLRLALAAWAPVATIAVAAGWLMAGAVWLFLGLDPVHPGLFLAVVALGAMCFSAIAHLLRIRLGTAGSSLLLVLLILQLSASGGTYPAPLLPPFFAAIGRFLPLTYLIDAYRVTISGGLMSHLGRDVGILAAVLVAVLTLTVLSVRQRQQFSLAQLHPPLTAP